MRYLMVFNNGDTIVIEGYDLEDAVTFAALGNHSMKDVISVVKIDN